MKKLILMLLLVVGGVMSASATKTRLYISMVDNWKNNSGGTKLYAWYGDNKYTGEYGSEANKMTQIGSTNWYYIDADFPEVVHLIIYNPADNWKSSNIYNVNIKNKYLNFTSDVNGSEFAYTPHTMGYVLYDANGTTIPMNSNDGNIFTATIDNETNTTNDEYFIAPQFMIDNYANDDARWYFVLRPWDEHQILSFTSVTDYGCGYYKAGNVYNSNSLKLNNVAAHFEFTFNATNDSYSIEPYIERTLYPAVEGYSTFSSIYNVAIPSGIDASYVTGVEGNNLTTVAYSGNIKAGDAALIHANLSGSDPVVYKFTPATVASENIAAASGNKLVAVDTEIPSLEATDGSKTNYILTNNTVQGTKAVGFYKANSNRVAAGKAYLQLSAAGARSFFPVWGDETTQIKGMEAEQHDGEIFNLNGQRVNKAVKGLYIVNGKKVMFK